MTIWAGVVLGLLGLGIVVRQWRRERKPIPANRRVPQVELMVVHRGFYRSIEYVEVRHGA